MAHGRSPDDEPLSLSGCDDASSDPDWCIQTTIGHVSTIPQALNCRPLAMVAVQMSFLRFISAGSLALAASAAHADATYHPLANGGFSQDWSNTGLITTDNIWTGVPSIEGYRGDGLTGSAGTDPRTIVAFGATPLDVKANVTNATAFMSGGLIEAESGADVGNNPTIAFQGSGTADAPFLLLRLNTTGCTNIQVGYLLRDIDTGETIGTSQQVVVQGRLGESANLTEIPGTYVAAANNNGTTTGAFTLAMAYENQAQVQLRWLTTNAPNTDAMIGIDDITVIGTCTGGVDNPPTVLSTTPANNATGVAPDANILVQFSEAVTTDTNWFALTCAQSGPVLVAETGVGSTRTLNPVGTLTLGEVCTAGIIAAQVIDIDGTPQAMVNDYSFQFTVRADTVPTVTNTSPGSNATNVSLSSNISVSFSEPVTVSGNWYSVSCATSGAHPATVSGGPTTYVIDPTTNFVNVELCTVVLTGSLILDQDGTPNPVGSDYTFSFTTIGTSLDYYQGVDTSSPAALRTFLHNLIDDHTAYRYSIGTNTCDEQSPTTQACDVWDIVELTEQDPTESNKVLDVYRNRKYVKITDRSGNTGPTTYNREHTWPNSLGFGDLGGVDVNDNPFSPYTDAHMLYASASDHNSDRGNKPYDDCAGCTSVNATDLNHGRGGPSFPNLFRLPDGNQGSYEVWVGRKGDVARAILYMDVRYAGGTHANGQVEPDLIATNNRAQIVGTGNGVIAAMAYMGILDTIIAWHFADLPDMGEVNRNDIVFRFQGNRNPFIDHPEYVACIFQNTCVAGEDLFANGFE